MATSWSKPALGSVQKKVTIYEFLFTGISIQILIDATVAKRHIHWNDNLVLFPLFTLVRRYSLSTILFPTQFNFEFLHLSGSQLQSARGWARFAFEHGIDGFFLVYLLVRWLKY